MFENITRDFRIYKKVSGYEVCLINHYVIAFYH